MSDKKVIVNGEDVTDKKSKKVKLWDHMSPVDIEALVRKKQEELKK